MTPLWQADAYRREAPARVLAASAEGIVVDAPLFYPAGGGQPGDTGRLVWEGGENAIVDTRKAESGVLLLPAPDAPLPPVGAEVIQRLDWARRFAHMRLHTALHLLSVVLPFPVTGGQITAEKGRLDFDMEVLPEEKETLEARLNELVRADHPVTEDWITEAELDANPGLVKTLSVAPPRGAGRIRLIRIGAGEAAIDLQPCGGTHVARTGEIGPLRLGKVEKKGRRNRRVAVHPAG